MREQRQYSESFRHQALEKVLELPRFRGQFIALAIMKCFSKHSALNRIPRARTLCSAQ